MRIDLENGHLTEVIVAVIVYLIGEQPFSSLHLVRLQLLFFD